MTGFQLYWLCKLCQGDCCRIYEENHIPERKTVGSWSDEFHCFRQSYGIPPLFWPELVHQKENAHLIEILRSKGIDPYACEYLGANGCIIFWGNRPGQCVAYRCPTFKNIERSVG